MTAADPLHADRPLSGLDDPAYTDRATARRMRRVNSTVADGLANGFVEASQAFSDEVQGSSTFGDVLESAAAGMMRANGRFLAGLGNAVHRASDELADGRAEWSVVGSGTRLDYERLADLVAERLSGPSRLGAELDYERLADLVAERLAGRTDPII